MNRNLLISLTCAALLSSSGTAFAGDTAGAAKGASPPRPTASTSRMRAAAGASQIRSGKQLVLATTINVECGEKTYKVSTGSQKGSCQVNHGSDGKTESATCSDGAGNSATVLCNSGCSSTKNSGTCQRSKD